MTTYGDIIREYFPDADAEFCEFVLWEKTGFPSFWNIPEDGATPEECFRKQVLKFKTAEPPPTPKAQDATGS